MLAVPDIMRRVHTNQTRFVPCRDLVFQTEQPPVPGTATAADLGITELVVSARTYISGSSPERVQNIRTASAAFHVLYTKPIRSESSWSRKKIARSPPADGNTHGR